MSVQEQNSEQSLANVVNTSFLKRSPDLQQIPAKSSKATEYPDIKN